MVLLSGIPPDEEYRACVGITDGDDPGLMGLQKWTIPGGAYMRAKMKDWESHTGDIGKTFREMSQLFSADGARPAIEYYRSQKELFLFLPVK